MNRLKDKFKNTEFGHKNFPQNKSFFTFKCFLTQKKNQKKSDRELDR